MSQSSRHGKIETFKGT